MNMDFDFTDESGDGAEVEADQSGIYLTVSGPGNESGTTWLTAESAREIAQALNAAADYLEAHE